MGTLVFQATLGGQVNLTGPNTASTFTISVPAVTGAMITSGDTGTVTSTMISGPVTTAKGGTGLTSFTANGVVYASSSSVLTTGSALVFDGTNLGLSVTPSAWTTTNAATAQLKNISISALATNDLQLTSNGYFDGSSWRYIASSVTAQNYYQSAGAHVWRNAVAGTAGNVITWSQSMAIDSTGNVGIGTALPSASAILDVQSTTKGMRMPNMTTTQKNAISSPAAGLMVFDTTLSKLCVYSGSAWQTITSV